MTVFLQAVPVKNRLVFLIPLRIRKTESLHGTANSKNYLKLETYIDRAVIRAPKLHDNIISLYSN